MFEGAFVVLEAMPSAAKIVCFNFGALKAGGPAADLVVPVAENDGRVLAADD